MCNKKPDILRASINIAKRRRDRVNEQAEMEPSQTQPTPALAMPDIYTHIPPITRQHKL